jgi:hypothetical protein
MIWTPNRLEHDWFIPTDIWLIFLLYWFGGFLSPTMTDLLSYWSHSKTLRRINNLFKLFSTELNFVNYFIWSISMYCSYKGKKKWPSTISSCVLCQGPALFQGPWCSSAILTVRFPFTYLDNSSGRSLGTQSPPLSTYWCLPLPWRNRERRPL